MGRRSAPAAECKEKQPITVWTWGEERSASGAGYASTGCKKGGTIMPLYNKRKLRQGRRTPKGESRRKGDGRLPRPERGLNQVRDDLRLTENLRSIDEAGQGGF